MSRQRISRPDRIRYYRAAADFWLEAIRLQQTRCLQASKSSQARADVNFYLVAVQRLREVARMARDRLKIEEARQALDKLDRQWPRLKELRDSEEHILGPALDAPAGINYFDEFVADLQPGGGVEYLAHARHMGTAINELHAALHKSLDADEGQPTRS